MKKMMNTIKAKGSVLYFKTTAILNDKRGEGYVDTVIKILLAVVLGSLLLAGLYTLFGETVLFSSRYSHDRDCYA